MCAPKIDFDRQAQNGPSLNTSNMESDELMERMDSIAIVKITSEEFCANPLYHMPYLNDYVVTIKREDGHSCTLMTTEFFESWMAEVDPVTRVASRPMNGQPKEKAG